MELYEFKEEQERVILGRRSGPENGDDTLDSLEELKDLSANSRSRGCSVW